MSRWTSDQLGRIGRAEELQIASLRRDGTQRNRVTVWVVRHGDSLYVRSVRGRKGSWFRGVQETHQGRVRAGGIDKDVTFVDADLAVYGEVDAAYRAKYRRYAGSILNSVLSADARSATLELVPRP
jgi:hypothetical protein